LSGVVGGLILLALSDKTRLRKIFFITPALIFIIVIGFLAVAKATVQLWTLIVIAGFTYGSLMAILGLVIAETKGIGTRYAGTANSISSGVAGGAGLVFAAVSGKLALSSAISPFIFGPLLCLVCVIPFFFARETGTRNLKNSQNNNQ
jgi:MFS family permease